MARPLRLAIETVSLVAATVAIALPLGILLALFLFRTDAWGRRLLLAVIGLSAFVPLPLHATAWLGALGNAGRAQAFGVRPILVGLVGAAVVHALAALPWVVLIVGVGLCAVEPELEESALLDYGPGRVLLRVTLRRALGAIAAAALAVAVLTAGDMTVTDLLQIRTYAEEAYLQYSLGRGPGGAALVALPPLVVLGLLILIAGRALGRFDPARLVSSFSRARLWQLGRWRIPCGAAPHGLDRQRGGSAALQPGLACGPGRGTSHAGPASHLVAFRIDGNVAVRGRRDLGTAEGEPGLDGHRRHADGPSRLRPGVGQPPVDGLADRGPGHAGPDARHARPGRRHGLGPGLSCLRR